jgi:hypothetical protein
MDKFFTNMQETNWTAFVSKDSEILLEYTVLHHSRQHSSEVNLINHFSSISFPPRKSQLLLLQQVVTFSNLTYQERHVCCLVIHHPSHHQSFVADLASSLVLNASLVFMFGWHKNEMPLFITEFYNFKNNFPFFAVHNVVVHVNMTIFHINGI